MALIGTVHAHHVCIVSVLEMYLHPVNLTCIITINYKRLIICPYNDMSLYTPASELYYLLVDSHVDI